jgi:aspartyl-tRNA(Asn)/glutamyl-tRNA(Gln) amidotransferase subunit B
MKNLNSFKMVRRAIEYEAKRQIEELENGGKIIQQTRKWDDNKGKSFPMRSKENSNDYRYFPDPDLLTIEIDREDVEEIRKTIPLLAEGRKKIYVEKYGLPEYDAKILTNDKFISDYFENCLKIAHMPKQISNWIMTDVLKLLKDYPTEDLTDIISETNLMEIIALVDKREITRPNSKALFEIVANKTLARNADKFDSETLVKDESTDEISARAIAEAQGMLNSFSHEELVAAVEKALTEFASARKDYTETPDKVLRFYIGKVMAFSKGLANPQEAERLLKERL